MFTPLNKEEIQQIVKLQLNNLAALLLKKDIKIAYTPEVLETISNKGFDPQFGARPVKRVIQKEILNLLSKELLSGKITSTNTILLDSFDDKIVFRNQ